MYAYQKDRIFTAQVADGLEFPLHEELEGLGAENCQTGFRFVHFAAKNHTNLYRILYQSRLASRFLAPLMHFSCKSEQALYATAREIRWSDFLEPSQTFAIFANVSGSAMKHSQYAALKLKDALADWFRDRHGRRPNVDTRNPHLWLHLHLHNNCATISVDISGGALHRRGYRQESVDAPMQETVAAALVYYSSWKGETPLIDPLCGSGTLLCEALMRAKNIPAGFLRRQWGIRMLPDFEPETWKKTRSLPEQSATVLLRGSDIDPKAVAATRTNLACLPGGEEVIVGRRDFFERTDLRNCTILCNPPYGLRLEKQTDMGAWYKRMGDHLKQHCSGSTAYIYFGEKNWLKSIGLRASWKKPLKNGGLDGRLAKFELY